MKTIAVAAVGLLGALWLSASVEAGNSFPMLRDAAVAWTSELPCGGWDCNCEFRRQRGCCCIADALYELEDTTFYRVFGMYEKLEHIQEQIEELTEYREIAFTASMTAMTQCFGPFTTSVPIPYRDVTLNQGFGYNPALGLFTAPCHGVYSFTFTAYSYLGAAGERLYHKMQLMKNGQVVASVWEDNREDSEDSGTHTVLLQLRQGCQVYMELQPGRELCGDRNGHNRFSGYLVYPHPE